MGDVGPLFELFLSILAKACGLSTSCSSDDEVDIVFVDVDDGKDEIERRGCGGRYICAACC